MASIPIPEATPLRAPQGVHLLLSVGVSAVFWNLAWFWLSGSGPSWPGAPLGLLYAVFLGFWAPWRQRTRQGPLLKFWLWLVMTLLLYGALAFAEGRPWPQTLGYDGVHSLWFLQGFLQGQVTALWAGQLTSRARLYQLIEGVPTGKVLEDRVREFQLDADFSKANAATLSASLAILATVAVALATFSPFGTGGLSAALAGGFLALCLLVGVLLRTYRREMEGLMYGRRFTLAEKLVPVGWSALLVCLAALGAWALMGLGGPWVDWNALLQGQHRSLPPALPDEVADQPPRPHAVGGDMRLAVLVTILEILFRVRNIFAVVEFLIKAATWTVPVAIGAFLLWPLFRWVVSGGRETRGLGRRWWELLVDQWKAFLTAVAGWWRSPRSTVAGALPEASTPREWIRSLFRRPPAGRRAPYPEVVEAFLSLVRWAEPLTPYRSGETTREYLDRLVALAPAVASELTRVRDLLDRELFGPRGLDASERQAFLDLVARVVAGPPSHESVPGVS